MSTVMAEALTGESSLTDAEKIRFDLKGYLIFPGVLDGDEIGRLKEQTERIRTDPESLPPAERQLPGGASSMLIDHPAVMRVLRSVIDPDVEKIRLESAFLSHRERDDGHAGWNPHAGGRTLNPNYHYQANADGIYAGMTRVVWELNEVPHGRGGTAFIPGSHKSNFHRKQLAVLDDPRSGVWETYSCPPGSLLVFSEAVRHSACAWTHDRPREALFFAYNHICVRHHRPTFSGEMLDGLSSEHRRFFNDVHHPG